MSSEILLSRLHDRFPFAAGFPAILDQRAMQARGVLGMYVHSQLGRKLMGWTFGVLAVVPSVLCFVSSVSPSLELSDVTGRLTYSGQPLNDMTLCLDSTPGIHCAYASLSLDGSFRLISMTGNNTGAAPGRYHAHLYTHLHGPSLPARYRDPRTSGLEIEVASDWNEFDINLH
jgi:hypothetical protein